MNYKSISKITIYSILIFIFIIVGLTIFIIDFPNWKNYGWEWLSGKEMIPISIQASRAWCLSSLIISLFLMCLIIWEIKKMEMTYYKKYFIASLGIFTWMIIPYIIYIGIKEKSYTLFLNYISKNKDADNQISFNILKNGLIRKCNKNKIFWNTLFCYFVFSITIIDFVFVFLIPEPKLSNLENPNNTITFNTFSYFTQLSNMACFFFMLLFVFFHNKIMFRNNTLMISLSGYIFIVSTIFWGGLIFMGENYDGIFAWLKTSWLHAVTPVFFILFFITSLLTNKEAPKQFKKIFGITTLYPLVYGIYVYLLPLITRVSIYGTLTNLNPDMITPDGVVGNPWNIFFIILMIFYFFLVILLFWSISFYINKKLSPKISQDKKLLL